jgi:hypothetical protein
MKIEPTKSGFKVSHTTREVWGVDDDSENVKTDYTRFSISLEGEQWMVGRKRSTRKPVRNYITEVSFREGNGLRIKGFRYSPTKTKAFGFGKLTAEAIAKQLTDGTFGKRYFGVKVDPLN